MKITTISKDEKTWIEDECSDGIEIYFGKELIFDTRKVSDMEEIEL